VYKLSKALYVLKQAPWAWHARLKTFLLEHGYVIGSVDKTLFTINHGNVFLLVEIYMDDIIFGISSQMLVLGFQEMMEKEFQMSMMGELIFFLCIQAKQKATFVHQAKYTNDLMKKFNMAELKLVSTPMIMATSFDPDENGETTDQIEYKSMIGSLLYLTTTRLDIQFIVCLCARFQASPCSLHRIIVQLIFRYLKYTIEFGIWYSASSSLDLVCFSNSDFTGCGIDQKSTFGTCHFLGPFIVCWSSQKQSLVAESTTEVEYVAAAIYWSQILWFVHTLQDFGVISKRVPLMCNNTSAISIPKNQVFHKRMRHHERRHQFLRDHVEKGDIVMKYNNTKR
jgi:hypothetical protein